MSRKKTFGRKAASYMVWLLFGGSLMADYQTALDAYSAGDYAAAMREWREVTDGPPTAASPGEFVESHYAVAMLYWEGQGVQQSYREAYHWLLRAANMNHAGAQAKLGFLYIDGKGVVQDYDQAFIWFGRAARQGNPDGLYNLGICHLYGWGTEPDRTMAKQYLAAAAALGDGAAEQALQQLQAEPAPNAGGRSAAEESSLALEQGEAGAVGADSSATEPPGEPETPIAAEAAPTEAAPTPEDAVIPEPAQPAPVIPEPAQPVSGIHDQQWILSRNPAHYTIQVIALSSRKKTESLVIGHERLAPFALYTVENNQRPLYVLIQGDYPDVESARAARDRFPNAIQNPDLLWIRQFGKIHELIEP